MKYTVDDIQIFILTHNRKELVVKMLNSVLKQTARINKVTILGNDCIDGTDYIFENYSDKRVEYIKTKKENGSYLKILELASKKYVALFHDDDFIHPQYIEAQLSILNKLNIEPVLMTAGYTNFTDESSIDFSTDLNFNYYIPDGAEKFSDLVISGYCRACYAATIYKTEFYKKIKIDNLIKKYGRLADYFVMCDVLKYGCGSILYDNKAYMHRIHKNMDSFNPATKISNRQFKNLGTELQRPTNNFKNISVSRQYEVLSDYYSHLHKEIDFGNCPDFKYLIKETSVGKLFRNIYYNRYNSFLCYIKYLLSIKLFKKLFRKKFLENNNNAILKDCIVIDLSKEKICERSV